MRKIAHYFSTLLFFGFITLLFFVAAESEDSTSSLTMLVIILGAFGLSAIAKPKPVGIESQKTRKSLLLPAYVENCMTGRWILLIGGGILAGALQSEVFWAICIAGFIGMTEYASRRYYREDKVSWEIAFHSEVDGFSSSDGDGDGD